MESEQEGLKLAAERLQKLASDSFRQGVFYSAGLLVTFFDQPSSAGDIIEQAGFLDADVSDLGETEQKAMKELMKQDHRVKFTSFTI